MNFNCSSMSLISLGFLDLQLFSEERFNKPVVIAFMAGGRLPLEQKHTFYCTWQEIWIWNSKHFFSKLSKGVVHSKLTIRSSFTHSEVISYLHYIIFLTQMFSRMLMLLFFIQHKLETRDSQAQKITQRTIKLS